MTLTLELSYEAESKLREKAERAGMDPADFASNKLSDGIDILDAIAAATALRMQLTLVTFNGKHFRSIPDLQTLQPYKRK